MTHLATAGAEALERIGPAAIEDAWRSTVEAFRDPGSPERRTLDPALARLCRLSPAGLAAGLEAVLGGVAGEPASRLFTEARSQSMDPGTDPSTDRSPVVVLLASNLPALAVQPLLPALALRRPVLLKSPSAEPLFAPAFVRALVEREPRLAEALAAITWTGGDRDLEAPVLAAAGLVLVYGETETVADVEARAPGKVMAYGPRTSLAVVGRGVEPQGVEPQEVCEGLARDVALLDQRGCLSVAAVYVEGEESSGQALATGLARELGRLAQRWPPGPADPASLAAVQQVRGEAAMRGLAILPVAGEVAAGTVVVEPDPAFRPTPGLRTVRVHSVADLARLPELLDPWRERLQGVAVAGPTARALAPALFDLGVSRVAAPGRLQTPDALWHNGGVHPLAALLGDRFGDQFGDRFGDLSSDRLPVGSS